MLFFCNYILFGVCVCVSWFLHETNKNKKNAESGIRVLVITGPGFSAMGKSPGKWIKAVLFGKKSSKSNVSKGREVILS